MFCLKSTGPMMGIWLSRGMGISGSVFTSGGVRVMPMTSLGKREDNPVPIKNSAKPTTNWSIFNVVVKYAKTKPKRPPAAIATSAPIRLLPVV